MVEQSKNTPGSAGGQAPRQRRARAGAGAGRQRARAGSRAESARGAKAGPARAGRVAEHDEEQLASGPSSGRTQEPSPAPSTAPRADAGAQSPNAAPGKPAGAEPGAGAGQAGSGADGPEGRAPEAAGAKPKRSGRGRGDREMFLRSLTRAERKRWRRGRTRRLIACVGVLALCLFFALVVGDADYHATPVGWVPLFACLAAIAGAFAYLQALKRGLRMEEASDLGSCERGQDVSFRIRFRNATPLYFTRIEASFFVADMEGNAVSRASTTLVLSPFEVYDMEVSTRFDHIGTYRAGLEHVVVSDFLRLFEAPLEGPKNSFVHVTPRIVAVERIEFSNESALESTKANRTTLSDSMDYSGVRDYVPGDPLKTIHWKLSARSEDYLTRLFETYTNPGVSVIMDFYGPGDTPEDRMGMFDAVVETAFSVGRYAQLQGMDTEIHYVDRHGSHVRQVAWTKSDLPRLVADMPEFSNDKARQVDAIDLVEGETRSQYGQNNLVVCTANISAEMVSAVVESKLRHRQPLVFAVAPRGLEGRDRDRWAAPLARLDAAGIGYVALADVSELLGVRA